MGEYIIDQESFFIINRHVLDCSGHVVRGSLILFVLGEKFRKVFYLPNTRRTAAARV